MELKLLNRLCINNKFQEMYHCRVTSALQLLVCDVFWNFADGNFVNPWPRCTTVLCSLVVNDAKNQTIYQITCNLIIHLFRACFIEFLLYLVCVM